MTVPPALFRRVLGRLAGGVAVVTSRDDHGTPRGMTATSVCSVSLEPPLVLACLARGSATRRAIAASDVYGLSFLAEGDEDLARRFATEADDKFAGLPLEAGPTGCPILPRALAWCDCAVVEAVPAGDHTIYVGRVEGAGVADPVPRRPLVYYRGRYGGLSVRAGEGDRDVPEGKATVPDGEAGKADPPARGDPE